jgi:hypothetical protein
VRDFLYIPERKRPLCASYDFLALDATNPVTKPPCVPPVADSTVVSSQPTCDETKRHAMHFFNPFGAAQQFQEPASFPDAAPNEIEISSP